MFVKYYEENFLHRQLGCWGILQIINSVDLVKRIGETKIVRNKEKRKAKACVGQRVGPLKEKTWAESKKFLLHREEWSEDCTVCVIGIVYKF